VSDEGDPRPEEPGTFNIKVTAIDHEGQQWGCVYRYDPDESDAYIVWDEIGRAVRDFLDQSLHGLICPECSGRVADVEGRRDVDGLPITGAVLRCKNDHRWELEELPDAPLLPHVA
jgi:hypothetical protein